MYIWFHINIYNIYTHIWGIYDSHVVSLSLKYIYIYIYIYISFLMCNILSNIVLSESISDKYASSFVIALYRFCFIISCFC